MDKDLKLLQEWLDRPEGGDFFLRGREAEIWESEKDLIALSSRQAEKDTITRFISDRLVPWYHRRWGHRVKVLPKPSEHLQLLRPCYERMRLPLEKIGMAYGIMMKQALLLLPMPSVPFFPPFCRLLQFSFYILSKIPWQEWLSQ